MNTFFRSLQLVTALFFSGAVYSQNIDIDILKPVNKTRTDFKHTYLDITASSVAPLSIGIPVVVFATGLIKHDGKLQKDGLYMAGAFVVTAVITQGTKHIINKKRPFETYSFIVKRDDEKAGHSFPSGHTSSAFCTATSLSLRYPEWYVIAPSYLWAASVGWARMYQGVHYPSDVLAGAIIGAGSAWVGYKLQQKLEKKHTKSVRRTVDF